jgi:hypothetical protein
VYVRVVTSVAVEVVDDVGVLVKVVVTVGMSRVTVPSWAGRLPVTVMVGVCSDRLKLLKTPVSCRMVSTDTRRIIKTKPIVSQGGRIGFCRILNEGSSTEGLEEPLLLFFPPSLLPRAWVPNAMGLTPRKTPGDCNWFSEASSDSTGPRPPT